MENICEQPPIVDIVEHFTTTFLKTFPLASKMYNVTFTHDLDAHTISMHTTFGESVKSLDLLLYPFGTKPETPDYTFCMNENYRTYKANIQMFGYLLFQRNYLDNEDMFIKEIGYGQQNEHTAKEGEIVYLMPDNILSLINEELACSRPAAVLQDELINILRDRPITISSTSQGFSGPEYWIDCTDSNGDPWSGRLQSTMVTRRKP